jgi:hypothetical protein
MLLAICRTKNKEVLLFNAPDFLMNIASFEGSRLQPLVCEDHQQDDGVWSIYRNKSTFYINIQIVMHKEHSLLPLKRPFGVHCVGK